MKAPFFRTALLVVCLARSIHAEEPTPRPTPEPPKPLTESKPTTEEQIRARLVEHTKMKAAAKAAAVTPTPATTDRSPITTTPEKTDPAKIQAQPPAVMPKVEVNKARVTVLDHQLQEQEKDIDREKKLTKSSELDRALNGPQVSISILGGESTKYRTTVASERVSMMEEEKDLIEAIAHAKTKEEKTELQKELVEIKAMRRDLEKSLR